MSRQFPFPNREESHVVLEHDPCFSKIPSEEVEGVFERAWNTGVAEAETFLKEHQQLKLMDDVLTEEGFEIITEDVDFVIGTQRYFCEYMPKDKKIMVYKKSMELWAQQQELSYEEAKNVILAHEYFHYLENTKLGWVSRQYMVPMLIIGKRTFGQTGVPALSEVAANAFANRVYTERFQRRDAE